MPSYWEVLFFFKIILNISFVKLYEDLKNRKFCSQDFKYVPMKLFVGIYNSLAKKKVISMETFPKIHFENALSIA